MLPSINWYLRENLCRFENRFILQKKEKYF